MRRKPRPQPNWPSAADADLLRQDSELSAAYGKLGAARPDGREALRQDQRDWLRARNRCGAQASCIRDQYLLRLSALQDMLRSATAYVPDETDRLALEDLRQAVEAASRTNAEFPVEDTLAALSVKTGATTFANVRENDDDDLAKFPIKRPEGVTPDEWQALQASGIDAGGENGVASYTLMDLDGDGQRDLVVDSYTGGTGLFSDISALRRNGGRYTEAVGANGEAASGLYTLNGRGSNQAGEWIRLRGRVYAAYRNSTYGVDHIHLLRPFHAVGEVPTLTVQYRYQLQVPKEQKRSRQSPGCGAGRRHACRPDAGIGPDRPRIRAWRRLDQPARRAGPAAVPHSRGRERGRAGPLLPIRPGALFLRDRGRCRGARRRALLCRTADRLVRQLRREIRPVGHDVGAFFRSGRRRRGILRAGQAPRHPFRDLGRTDLERRRPIGRRLPCPPSGTGACVGA